MPTDTKETKVLAFTLKSLTEEGTFEGLAAVYGNVDLGGDLIEPGAFTKSLNARNHKVRLFLDHDAKQRVGTAYLLDLGAGLQMRGVLNLDKAIGRDAYADLKHYQTHDLPMEMSIGYRTVQEQWTGGVRHLKVIDLWEVSLVSWGMNPRAQVTDVKAAEDVKRIVERDGEWCVVSEDGRQDLGCYATEAEAVERLRQIEGHKGEEMPEAKADSFATIYSRIQLWQARSQMQEALWYSLDTIVQDEAMTPEDKASAADTSLTEFHQAVLTWLGAAMGQYKAVQAIQEALETKAGRVLSRRNMKLVQDAVVALQAMIDAATAAEVSEDDEKQAPADEVPPEWRDLLADMTTFIGGRGQ
jgi:uncharacterized protein